MVTPTRDNINAVSLVEVIYNCSSSETKANSYFMSILNLEVERYFDFLASYYSIVVHCNESYTSDFLKISLNVYNYRI
jgi:hypothetical protein